MLIFVDFKKYYLYFIFNNKLTFLYLRTPKTLIKQTLFSMFFESDNIKIVNEDILTKDKIERNSIDLIVTSPLIILI